MTHSEYAPVDLATSSILRSRPGLGARAQAGWRSADLLAVTNLEPGNLVEALDRAAAAWPDRPALIADDGSCSFAELRAGAERIADGLSAAGVESGQAVALLFSSALEFAVALHGVLRLGAVAVPLNAMLLPDEAGTLLENARACTLLADRQLGAALAAALPEVRLVLIEPAADEPSTGNNSLVGGKLGPDDVAVLQYTSGTTGEPQGAELTHGAFLAGRAIVKALDLGPGDVLLCGTPMFSPPGVFMQLTLPQVGAALISCSRFDAAWALEAMQRYGATHFFGVPTMLEYLLALPEVGRRPLRALRVLGSLGAPASSELLERASRSLGGRAVNLYGASEAMVVAFSPLEADARLESVGLPAPGVSIRIADDNFGEVAPGEVGQVWIQAPTLMRGYRGRPAQTAEVLRNGRLRTGDIGFVDQDGYLHLVDRADSIINRAGFKVAPAEVERVLAQHPAVREVAVAGVPDKVKGELIRAMVVLKDDRLEPSRDELRGFCRQWLAPYKLPDIIDYRSDLPRNASGKVQRHLLRDGAG